MATSTEPAQSIKKLLEMFDAAIKIADDDPFSRYKIQRLDNNTQRVRDSNSKNSATFLMKSYQSSPGLQKLVDTGFDFAERMDTKFLPKDTQKEIQSGFALARKFLGGLKKDSLKSVQQGTRKSGTSTSGATKVQPQFLSDADSKSEFESVESETSGMKASDMELTPPLHNVLNIYLQIVKRLTEVMKEKTGEALNIHNITIQESSEPQTKLAEPETRLTEPETSLEASAMVDHFKELYKKSPTLRKTVDTGLNFAEKIAIKMAPKDANEIQKGFELARKPFTEWKAEIEQAQPNQAYDPGAGPVRVKPKPLKNGTIDPVSDNTGVHRDAPPIPTARPKFGSSLANPKPR